MGNWASWNERIDWHWLYAWYNAKAEPIQSPTSKLASKYISYDNKDWTVLHTNPITRICCLIFYIGQAVDSFSSYIPLVSYTVCMPYMKVYKTYCILHFLVIHSCNILHSTESWQGSAHNHVVTHLIYCVIWKCPNTRQNKNCSYSSTKHGSGSVAVWNSMPKNNLNK